MDGAPRSARRRLTVGTAVVVLAAALVAMGIPTTSGGFGDSGSNAGNRFHSDLLDPAASLQGEGGTTARLRWRPTTDAYADGHEVLRSTTAGGPYTLVGVVTPRSTSTVEDSPPTGIHYYVVRAFAGSWVSAVSNEVAVKVDRVTDTTTVTTR